MSAAKHTAGPVMVAGPTIQTLPTDTHPVGAALAHVLNPYAGAAGAAAMVEGNAARFAAAWNACAGISTEALEGGVVRDLLGTLQALADAYQRLMADRLPKRDEHLAAQSPVLIDARAAIAKATGSAS